MHLGIIQNSNLQLKTQAESPNPIPSTATTTGKVATPNALTTASSNPQSTAASAGATPASHRYWTVHGDYRKRQEIFVPIVSAIGVSPFDRSRLLFWPAAFQPLATPTTSHRYFTPVLSSNDDDRLARNCRLREPSAHCRPARWPCKF